ncbi:AAA-like domain-containing protein [Chroococcus sp. FPU101]|uniref:WD40 domain-containing protein n=1 Tax=Chroococcus sp. FPU101 TaxID=1974212 RepID=UPI001A8DD4BA|nr:AAA-like domain-containing protein [Chroococcus sp. FPU101]GFE70417.1 WD-40 repeat [Chroococcus sp. FPU101]
MKYQVGGSLRSNDPTYVSRQADEKLYKALHTGEFCYIFNSRQMGKSSLLQRTSYRLKEEGYQCLYLDVTRLGSEDTSSAQWYKGVIVSLFYGLNLQQTFNLKSWWEKQAGLSPIQQLHQFVEEILLPKSISDRLFIFIDEIDSLLSLKFPVDDFFAWIRHCYNQRAMNPKFKRLGFALFGVASPSDLISDKRRTPFNIGTAIELNGFQFHEATPLLKGLQKIVNQSEIVLRELIYWTGGQPFLTQKLCQIVWQTASLTAKGIINLPPGTESYWVEQIVRSHIIKCWESQDEPEHFRTIRTRLLSNEQRSGRLLGLYQQVLQAEATGQLVPTDDSPEQTELLLSGIVEKYKGYLRVKNPIYRSVFSHEWVTQQLDQLRPYASLLNAWVASGYQDESRLLRGLALQEALAWTQHKTLSNLDYKFLAASQELDRQEIQQKLETERLKEIEKRLAIERRNSRRVKWLLSGMTVKFLIAVALGVVAFTQYRQATLSEIQALTSASNGSFNSNQHLDALVQAIKAQDKLQKLRFLSGSKQTDLGRQTNQVLEQAVYGTNEINRFSGHQGLVVSVAYSPDSQAIATASYDRTIKLWKPDGTLIKTIPQETSIQQIQFSPDSRLIAAAGLDGVVRLWDLNGNLIKSFYGHQGAVWRVAFSPDGKTIASSSADYTVKLWTLDGTLVKTLKHERASWAIAFSPDGKTIATALLNGKYFLWNLDGRLIKTFKAPESNSAIWRLVFSPDGKIIASGNADNLIRLWRPDGTLLRSLEGHTAEIQSLAFSLDGRIIASASSDKTIKLWHTDGTLMKTFQGHRGTVRDLTFSLDGKTIASVSDDNTIRLWQVNSPIKKSLYGHHEIIWKIAFSPDGQRLASISGNEIKLWRRDGTLEKTLTSNDPRLLSLAFSPDGQTLAIGGSRADVRLWNLKEVTKQPTLLQSPGAGVLAVTYTNDGQTLITGGVIPTLNLWQRNKKGEFKLQQSFLAHKTRIWDLAISPDGQLLASASTDGTVKLWSWNAGRLSSKPYRILNANASEVFGVAFSPDNQLIATAGGDNLLRIWRTDGTLVQTLTGGGIGLTRLAFSLDGQLIAAGGLDNTVKVWRVDGTTLATLNGHTSVVSSVAFSQDGKTLASSSDDQTIILWDLPQILNLNLINFGCNWVRDYLKTNTTVEKSERNICFP